MPAPDLETLRLFVAIDAPAEVRTALGALSERLRGISWVPPGQLHLTLRFVGATPSARVDEVIRRLDRIQVESFLLPVTGIGSFPPGRPPRVMWAGVGTGHPRLFQLRQRVDDALLAAGLTDLDVRSFHPHFTLARCGSGVSPAAVAGYLKKHESFEGPPFRVEAFTLYKSTLIAGGAVHEPLCTVALAPRSLKPDLS